MHQWGVLRRARIQWSTWQLRVTLVGEVFAAEVVSVFGDRQLANDSEYHKAILQEFPCEALAKSLLGHAWARRDFES